MPKCKTQGNLVLLPQLLPQLGWLFADLLEQFLRGAQKDKEERAQPEIQLGS